MVLHVPIRKWSRQASLQNGTWLIPILGIILVLYPSWNIGTASSAFPTVQLASTSLDNSAHVDGIPAPALYKEYSKKYFQNRSIRFAEDMTVRESYLAGLTHSIIKEIKARKKEKSLFPSDVLNHTWANLPPLTPFDSNLAEFKSANGTASLNKVYPAWEKSQFSEYFRAYLRVEEIRSQLINSATSGQKLRMFREEYRSGLEAYSHEQYQDAVLWFDGLLESYGYRTVDDVLFYRSEALMELEYLYQALAGYREIIEKFSQSPFWEDAIVRAFDILDQLNAVDQIKQLYQELEPELAKISPATQDIIDLKMCWISFADGDYDRTVIHANSISNLSNKSSTPKRLGQISASIALASAWAMKGDYSKAIPILQDVISQASRHSGISKEVERDLRDDARVRLGSIRFKMGEFKLSLEQLSQVVPTSRDYTLALLGMAWDHYYLKDFQKTIITTQELLTTYPGDAIGYEAKCLQTCSLPIPKSVDSTESAMADRNSGLQSIIDDAVRNWKLEEASLERERLLDGIQEVAGWEEAVFMDTAEQPSGAPAAERFDEVGSNNQASKPSDTSQARLFERYLRVRSYLTTLYKRLCILELYDASPLIQPVIREEAELARVANELNDVGASRLDGTEKVAFQKGVLYDRIQSRLIGIDNRLEVLRWAGETWNPPYYHAYQARFAASYGGTMMSRIDSEMGVLQNDLIWSKGPVSSNPTGTPVPSKVLGARPITESTGEGGLGYLDAVKTRYSTALQIREQQNVLTSGLDALDLGRTQLASGGRASRTSIGFVDTSLEHWAQFSFRRLFLSGGWEGTTVPGEEPAPFEGYYFQQGRLDDLDRYLKTINQLLENKNAELPPGVTQADSSGTPRHEP